MAFGVLSAVCVVDWGVMIEKILPTMVSLTPWSALVRMLDGATIAGCKGVFRKARGRRRSQKEKETPPIQCLGGWPDSWIVARRKYALRSGGPVEIIKPSDKALSRTLVIRKTHI